MSVDLYATGAKSAVDRRTRDALVEEIVYDADTLGENVGAGLEGGQRYDAEDWLKRGQLFVDLLTALDGWGRDHDRPSVGGADRIEQAKTRDEYEIEATGEFFSWLSDRLSSMDGLHFDDLRRVTGGADADAYDNYKLLSELQTRLRAELVALCVAKGPAPDVEAVA